MYTQSVRGAIWYVTRTITNYFYVNKWSQTKQIVDKFLLYDCKIHGWPACDHRKLWRTIQRWTRRLENLAPFSICTKYILWFFFISGNIQNENFQRNHQWYNHVHVYIRLPKFIRNNHHDTLLYCAFQTICGLFFSCSFCIIGLEHGPHVNWL